MPLPDCTRVCRTGTISTTSSPAHTKVARRASQRTASLKCSAPNALSSLPRPDDDSSWCAKFSAQKGRKRSPHDLIGLTRCEIAHIQVYVIPGDSFSARACDPGRWTRKRVATKHSVNELELNPWRCSMFRFIQAVHAPSDYAKMCVLHAPTPQPRHECRKAPPGSVE